MVIFLSVKGMRMPTVKFMHMESVRFVRVALRWKPTITVILFFQYFYISICVKILSNKPGSQKKIKIPKQRKEVTPK